MTADDITPDTMTGDGSDDRSEAALADDYAAAGFGTPLELGRRPGLVVVDAVIAYTEPECPLYAGPSAQAAALRMAEVVAATRALGVPVWFTVMDLAPDGSNAGRFFEKAVLTPFLPGSPYGALVPGLDPASDAELIGKQYPSAFFGTSLHEQLSAASIDTLGIIGYSTSGCVRASALDAMQYGYVPVVLTDAVADRDPGIHRSNLFDIGQKMANLAESEDWLGYLASLADPESANPTRPS